MKLSPGRDGDAHALLESRSTQVSGPGPGKNDDFDGTVARMHVEAAATEIADWPDVTTVEVISPDNLTRRLA